MPLTDLSDPDVLLRENWSQNLQFGADGTPLLRPDFVAELGPRVWLIDVRDDDELTGSVGHIPGVWRLHLSRMSEVAETLSAYTPVVLICSDGARSSTAARYLTALGMTTVAAMEGGMHHWRNSGFEASRDAAVLQHLLSRPRPGCGSDERPLIVKPASSRLTAEALAEHVGEPAKVRRVKLAALLLASQTSCVDGREDRAIIGTPGGDSGELMLGLSAIEQAAGGHVDLNKMDSIVRAFADTFGGIYLHTDNGALNRLARSLRNDSRLEGAVAGFNTVKQWERFLRRPPQGVRKDLMEHLLEPSHVGCGHLKLAMTRPDQYEIRPELIQAFFRSFYTSMWDGTPDLEWVVLGGDHAEGGVVNVMLEGELWPFSMVPMVVPSIGGVQMFVNHPQVVSYLRFQTTRFLSTRAASLLPVGKDSAKKLETVLPELGGRQATATLVALAAGLPVMNLHFRGAGVEIEEAGTIPSASA